MAVSLITVVFVIILITPIVVGTPGSTKGLSAERTQGSARKDFSSFVVMRITVFAPPAADESAEAGSSKRTFGKMALLMMVGAGASITPDDGPLDVIILIVRVFFIAPVVMSIIIILSPRLA